MTIRPTPTDADDGLADEVRSLLGALVGTASENPSLAPGGAGEGAIADLVTTWAQHAGLGVERVEPTAGRPSLLVTAPGRTSAPPGLLLCGHLDTVGVGAPGLEPRIVGDRLHGRGAYDMKAGLAAALVAMRVAAARGLDRAVVLAAVADEEDASAGVVEVLERHARLHPGQPIADAAIVLEPTELAVVVAHRGFAWFEIEVRGVAAHGSRPHLGVDAITRMAPVITALDVLNGELARSPHPLLGAGFLHASTISGGVEASTIPDRCVLVVERRTLPGETLDQVVAQVEQVLAACRSADPRLDVSLRTLLHRPPLEAVPTHPHVLRVRDAARRVLGADVSLEGASYWADSALIADTGVPTVVFGPAGEGAHASEEWVSLSSTVDCARALLVLLDKSEDLAHPERLELPTF